MKILSYIYINLQYFYDILLHSYATETIILITTSLILSCLSIFVFFLSRRLVSNLNYKIHNFYLNTMYILIYLGFYLIFISVLRYNVMGRYLDLKLVYNKIIGIFSLHPIIILLLCSVTLFAYLTMVYCRLFLLRQIRMRHFHYKKHLRFIRNTERGYAYIHNQKIKETYYRKLQDFLYKYYPKENSYMFGFPRGFLYFIIDKSAEIYCKIKYKDNKDNDIERLDRIGNILFNKQPFKFLHNSIFNPYIEFICSHPIILLLGTFVIECWRNNFVLYVTLYLLLPYMIWSTYNNIVKSLSSGDPLLDHIIYIRYYNDINLCINLSEEDEMFILSYIRLGFKKLHHLVDDRIRSLFYSLLYQNKLRDYDVIPEYYRYYNTTNRIFNKHIFYKELQFTNDAVYTNNNYGSFILTNDMKPTYVEGMKKYEFFSDITDPKGKINKEDPFRKLTQEELEENWNEIQRLEKLYADKQQSDIPLEKSNNTNDKST